MPHHGFKTGPACTHLKEQELHFHLYMHHYSSGSNANATTAVHSKHHNSFGQIAVNDWPIFDGPGPCAKTVARGQGLYVHAAQADHACQGFVPGVGYTSFTIKFNHESGFPGSTLYVMGDAVTAHESAVVGGTGEFTMARGIVKKSQKETNCSGWIVELHIHARYTPMKHGNAWSL